MNRFKSTNGITLIALVITIIIILILAGIAISSLHGDNGIINKTISTNEKSDYSSEKELVILSAMGARVAGEGVITTNNLNDELKLNFKDDNSVEEIPDGWIYRAKKKYTIYKDGRVVQIESVLPSEFQEVKYIENTDLQYIDTLFYANQDTRILCESVITDEFKSSYYQGLFGATDYDAQKEFNRNVVHMHMKSSTDLIVMATYGSNVETVGFKGDIRKRHIYELDKNVYKVDGNTIYTYPTSTFECSRTVNIFRDNNNIKSSQNKRCCKMKLYSFKIYDNETLIRDFIPCYCAKSVKDVTGKVCPQNTIGLYDIVNNEFYTNQGDGNFEIEKKYEYSYLLPDNLEGVKYIQSNGTQYIDTEINAKQHTNVIVEIDGNYTSLKSSQYVFGAGNASNSWILMGQTNALGFIGQIGKSGAEQTVKEADTERHIFALDVVSTKAKVDSEKIDLDSSELKEINYNYFLFALNNGGSIYNKSSFRMYSCKITENNNVLLNLIPCLDNEGDACMYDTISKQCFYNKGTGTFEFGQ